MKYKYYLITTILCFAMLLSIKALPQSVVAKSSDTLSDYLIQKVWSTDTCGRRGDREKVIALLLKDHKYLYNYDTSQIIQLFGLPVRKYTLDNGNVEFQYYSMLFKRQDGTCHCAKGMEGEGIVFEFDKERKKVIDYHFFTE